ncbi:hypothetical protein [Paraburkholderia youngii]|uniref:hypothetical protein n=1 Tax=Paraburkholderia youngii TaxID=2782701 RepID=UPI001591D8F5|nr:hypothetical protein [Paraburkholderia youngii]NUX58691.1 hypothetical protein [Paraburkholderia youngii]
MTDVREETIEQSQEEAPGELFKIEEEAQGEAFNSEELEPGSTVVAIRLVKNDEGGDYELLVEGRLIGTPDFDPANPCHRFLAVLAEHLPDLMDEVGAVSTKLVSSPAAAANDASELAS